MFGNSKKEIETLSQQINQLTKKIQEIKDGYEFQLKVLRQQFSAAVLGIPPAPASILSGLPYSELPKEQVLEFIQNTPNLLILDVRSDQGWSNGHLPNAKHIPAEQLSLRLMELSDKSRPILTICANGNTAVTAAQLLAQEGYRYVFNALGGMAGYRGPLVKPTIESSNASNIKGEDRELIRKVIEVIDRDVRPGLKRDGGDLQILAVEGGVVKVKMVGACLGCGSQKRTVEDGIVNHLRSILPEVRGVEDHS
jgi:Fe-S cluster biogenesis protein NfuA/rhodanese-related sulfurtransferase